MSAVNTSGVPRLTKFYSPLRTPAQPLVQKIFSLVFTRAPGLCNFLDAPDLNESLRKSQTDAQDVRVVYRNYATLYFVFVVDEAESELGILDLIQVEYSIQSLLRILKSLQVFVEALDRTFESVCELDLVFHFDEVLMSFVILHLFIDGNFTGTSGSVSGRARRAGPGD